jgi:hypothetical protein
LHAIQEKSLTTSQTAKIPVKEMGKRKRNNVMGGEEKGTGSFGPFSMFLDAWELRFPPLFPGISECPKGPQDTVPSPLIQSDVKSVTHLLHPAIKINT